MKRFLPGIRSFLIAPARQWLNSQPELVSSALRNARAELKIDRISRRSAKLLRQLDRSNGLKVHLGCGNDLKEGWVNIDLSVSKSLSLDDNASPSTLLINYDLRRGLPLGDETCVYIYSSHFFEHLEPQRAHLLMRDCYRVLRSEGILRLALPKQKDSFASYLQGDQEYWRLVDKQIPRSNTGAPRMSDLINYHVYQFGEHKFILDSETAVAMLKQVGFQSVEVSRYKEGIDRSSEIRRAHSFYVEAIK